MPAKKVFQIQYSENRCCMQAYIFEEFGRNSLKRVERPVPDPGPDEIVLKMKAVSLNFRDLLMLEGSYNPRMKLPVVPCSDGAGVVSAVGSSVKDWKIGDRAMPLFAPGWYDGDPDRDHLRKALGGPVDGTLQEYMCFRAADAVKIPRHLTDVEASTLPCAGLTAWSALVEKGAVKPGEQILTLGTGGVSIFALQFGGMLGAEVMITSGSDEKLERAKALGARHVINYKTHPNWEREIARITAMRGVDHVIEVGGMGTLERSVKSVRPGGTIYLIGVLAGRSAPVDLTAVLMQNIRIQGVVVGHRRAFHEMNRAIELHGMRPVVDRVFSFDEAPAAFDYLRSGSHFGKVCIQIDG
jgi:NADPH:quinone reductase-like Zn-dependent oxidoreductase